MKNKAISLNVATLVAALTCAAGLRAASISTTPLLIGPGAGQYQFQTVAFSDSAEAQALRDAYRILATGDHDYDGHRIRAMHSVEAAGKLLGMDLKGDLKDKTPQALSDDKLREAQNKISQVLGSAEVKSQEHVVKHLNEAVEQLNTALKTR